LSYLFNYGLFAGLMTDISFFADGWKWHWIWKLYWKREWGFLEIG
jgi:hypothetical protein